MAAGGAHAANSFDFGREMEGDDEKGGSKEDDDEDAQDDEDIENDFFCKDKGASEAVAEVRKNASDDGSGDDDDSGSLLVGGGLIVAKACLRAWNRLVRGEEALSSTGAFVVFGFMTPGKHGDSARLGLYAQGVGGFSSLISKGDFSSELY